MYNKFSFAHVQRFLKVLLSTTSAHGSHGHGSIISSRTLEKESAVKVELRSGD